jgi:hypothetical protein
MTEQNTAGSIDPQQAKEAAVQAKDAAAGVAEHGKQAAQDVAQTGKQAAQDVAQQTKKQAGDLLGQTRTQLTEQIEAQQGALVDTLRSLADQLGSMTEHTDESGTAVDLASQARDRARSAADWLNHREPNEVLDEVRRLGRERPGAFLLGAAVAGMVAGRLTRGVVAEHTDTTADSSSNVPAPVSSTPVSSTPSYSTTAPTAQPLSSTPSAPAVGGRPAPAPLGSAPLGSAPAPLGSAPRHEAGADHRLEGRVNP